MRTLIIIVITCLLCTSCGVKSNPEYKSQDNYKKTLYIV